MTVFYRNDDVRDQLDQSLIDFTNLCIRYKMPIAHAVEPANVTQEVVDWLIEVKKEHPGLIDIIQHGFDHNKNGKYHKKEFGGDRTYEDQYADIAKGKEMMQDYFGDHWVPIFTFPYAVYNTQSIQVLKDLRYTGISDVIFFNYKARLKNQIGRLLRKDVINNRKVSFHPKHRPNGLREASTSFGIIKKYHSENECDHFTMEEMIYRINRATKYTNILGVLFHHRFHGECMDLIEELTQYLIKQNFQPKSLSTILKT
jgi:peptidoglycan/xylan/chitin deacetylase (PgdA/CDA1 family)